MKQYILAHDLGTSGNKASLFDENGVLAGSITATYPTHYFNDNWAEQSPDDWWQAVCSTSRQLLDKTGLPGAAIKAICFSGHMMGCLCVDATGHPLRPHILWADHRAQAQADLLSAKISESRFYEITGHRCSPAYGLAKLMWVRDHEPDIFARTSKMVNAKDWLVFKMTGVLLSEYSDASSTNALDLNMLDWSAEILEAAGIGMDKMPSLVKSTHIAGVVTAEAALSTGLAEGIPVVMGGGDGLCGTVGAGCVREGVVHACLGTSSWISYATHAPLEDQQRRTFNWAHVVPGMICPCGTMQTAGSSVSWFLREIAALECDQARKTNTNVFDLLNEQLKESPPGANGLIFLPYLLGERSPRWNPEAKGAFLGLKMESTRMDMLRSVLEGVAMNLGIILDIYRANGCDPAEIMLIGGGARNTIWCQILADIWNVRIRRVSQLEEATSMGAAVIGGVGTGIFADFSAVDRFITIDRTFEPAPATVEAYQPVKALFEQAYQALQPLFPLLGGIGRHEPDSTARRSQ